MKNRIACSLFAVSFLLWLFSACVTDYSTPPQFQQEGRLAIEGFITGDTDNNFILSRTVPLSADSAFLPETGATLYILSSDGESYGPAEEKQPGTYHIPMGTLNTSAKYCLEFQTGGETYQSEYISPNFSPEIDSIFWNKEGDGKPLEIYVSTHDEQKTKGYYLWTFQEDWEFTSNYEAHWLYDLQTNTYYYEASDPYFFCWNKDTSKKILIASTEELAENRIVNQKIHSIPCQDIRISFLYCITIKQQTLSKNGYQYYKEKQKIIEDAGSIFAPQPSELKGNIICKTQTNIPVTGYIDVTTITRQRAFIKPDGIYEHRLPECTIISPEFGFYDLSDKAMYQIGYRPIITAPGRYPDFWVNKACRECTELGTKNKPDFWPNDHQ